MLSKNYNKLTDTEKKKILTEYYIKQKLSFGDIAVRTNTYANKIRRDAQKLNIPIRSKSEAQKNALCSGKHKHPTKGKHRDSATKAKIGLKVLDSWASLSKEELASRKAKSKEQWENMSATQKQNMQHAANSAVRNSAKTGSKLEKFLYKALLSDGYKVDFHKEQMLSNTKLHIDIFLPTMNMAIEVDGPSHFQPVWGQEALKKNQKYDNKKNGLLIGKGIKILRIQQKKDFSNARATLIYEKMISSIDKLYKTVDLHTLTIGDD